MNNIENLNSLENNLFLLHNSFNILTNNTLDLDLYFFVDKTLCEEMEVVISLIELELKYELH